MAFTKCKITVLKRMINKELADEYLTDNKLTACDMFTDGQEFIAKDAFSIPEGFCSWAWADMRGYILATTTGGSFPWMRRQQAVIACCTDGLRPVVFKIERTD
ncbi:MAG: TIGR04076 family protein [Spirochaetales bacterium]|nr:TIGR04076 family protein [Spirochaetales bacterium]